jgi:hypothetical protein
VVYAACPAAARVAAGEGEPALLCAHCNCGCDHGGGSRRGLRRLSRGGRALRALRPRPPTRRREFGAGIHDNEDACRKAGGDDDLASGGGLHGGGELAGALPEERARAALRGLHGAHGGGRR